MRWQGLPGRRLILKLATPRDYIVIFVSKPIWFTYAATGAGGRKHSGYQRILAGTRFALTATLSSQAGALSIAIADQKHPGRSPSVRTKNS